MARWFVGRLTEWRSAIIEMQRLHAKCIAQGVPSDALRMHTEREAYDAERGRIERMGHPVGHLRLPAIDLEAAARELDCVAALTEIDRLLK
jgi:hypothetical protein